MKIGLIPLDERPVNTRYPAMIARIAGVDLELPPPGILSAYRQPAQTKALSSWLQEIVPGLDALIVSFEMLGYGGLIASRISDESVGEMIARLDSLHDLKVQYPALSIYGFNLITRVSDADSAIEEPEYWATKGRRFFQLSQELDRQERGQPAPGLASLMAELPAQHRQDFIHRRLRNHIVNLNALQMLARGDLDLLVLSSDDTSPDGLPSSEKRILQTWAARLNVSDRLLMYPGADEIGCALLARAFNARAGRTPTFQVYYGVPGGDQVTASFEDVPVSVTVERQIRAVGGRLVAGPADFWVAVNPPLHQRGDWQPTFAEKDCSERLPHLREMADQICQRLAAGEAVILADVAYPNGADPVLFDLLVGAVDLTRLAAYGAWNTAGNTIGVALAQGCAARQVKTPVQRSAQQLFLLHRYLEDWGYQQVVRRETRHWLQENFHRDKLDKDILPVVLEHIYRGLDQCLARLPGFTKGFHLVQGSLRLPWDRLFEIDFEISE
jgi:hypothetical protein